MPTFLAIDTGRDTATIVAAEARPNSGIEIIGLIELGLKGLSSPEGSESKGADARLDSAAGAVGLATAPASDNDLQVPELDLENIFDRSFDAAFALMPNGNVLYQELFLPFRDRKRVDQVAALQVQDLLPFDLDNFVMHNLILGPVKSGDYQILTSLVSAQEVSATLAQLGRIGVDPKIVTTRASAVAALAPLCPDVPGGCFGIAALSPHSCSLAFFQDRELKSLREIPLEQLPDNRLDRAGIAHIRCSLAAFEKTFGAEIKRLFVIGPREALAELRDSLKVQLSEFSLSPHVRSSSLNDAALAKIPWAIGVFANELRRGPHKRLPMVDFRTGDFAYKPAIRNFLGALKRELYWFFLAVVCFSAWVWVQINESNSLLNKVDRTIAEAIEKVMPGEPVPPRREADYLKNRVTELEEQLKNMGTLSSLSPLQSLKELSEAMGPSIDVNVDAMNIGHSRITFRGSVPRYPVVAELNDVLAKKTGQFCEVKVEPKGKALSSGRINFSAEIKLCE